jgi:hypothetical protein
MRTKYSGGSPSAVVEPPETPLSDGGGQAAVYVWDDTTDIPSGSRVKDALADSLRWVFQRSPVLAMALGRIVLAVWPGFRGA